MFFISNLVSAANIYYYTKIDKGLLGYDWVQSTPGGYDGTNRVTNIVCMGHGLIQCKPGAGVQDDDLDLFAQQTLELINNEVDNGNPNGSSFKKIYRNNNGIETWVTFTSSWTTTSSGELKLTIIVEEVPYQL